MDRIATYLVLIPAAPLLSAVLIAILAPRVLRGVREYAALATIVALAVSFVGSLLLIREISYQHAHLAPDAPAFQRVVTVWTWADVPAAYEQPLAPPRAEDSAATTQGGTRDFRIDIALRADALTAMMLGMVTFVSLLVAVFSQGYMHGDRGYWRFFAYMSLFVFSMTMLVAASNFVLLFVFWEAVGLCSYLLIGFWYEKPSAAAAGQKAFLVNRVGDFGFALALFLLWITYGTLDYHTTALVPAEPGAEPAVVRQVVDSDSPLPGQVVGVTAGVLDRSAGDYVRGGVGLAICLLLLLGACGKSAQFPLHVWLPDAMEGPTPVSALIHAATMVTAGVYMVARCTPLFTASPEAQLVVACVGAGTALLAALIALTQFDLKRVLAYSTVSQLGYMFLALGAGTFAGVAAGMFHLFTHAFFKALLFLGSGSVMHAMGHVIDMRRFGGLRRIMPVTHWTFLVGCLALAGVFPFAGFWSKDAIVGAVHDRAHALSGHEEGAHRDEHGSGTDATARTAAVAEWTLCSPATAGRVYQGLYYLALLTALLTAFYTFRAFFLTFYGEPRTPPEAGAHAHESPPLMTVPLVILAICAIAVGLTLDQSYNPATRYVGGGRLSTGNVLYDFLGYTPQLATGIIDATRTGPTFHAEVALVSLLIAGLGIALAAYFYLESRREIDWVADFFRFEWYRRLLDADTVARWRSWSWVRTTEQLAQRLRLGFLTALVGRLVLLVLWVLTAPLIIANFVSPYRLSAQKFYFDELYDFVVVRPLRLLAQLCYGFDRLVIDGLVNACGKIPVLVGDLMRSLQTGLVQFYALSMVLGVVVLVLVRVLWGNG